MSKIALTTSGTSGHSLSLVDFDTREPVVGRSVNEVRAEIDEAFADMRTFSTREPDEIMRMVGGHSARLSELRVLCQRVEDYRREWRSIRERELEPTLDELGRQYNIASRLHAVREYEFRMDGGMP